MIAINTCEISKTCDRHERPSLAIMALTLIRKSEAQVATNEPAPLKHSQAAEELRTMPFSGALRDKSARDNTDQIKNIEEREADAKSPKSDWQPIGDVAAGIVRAASNKRGGA